MAGETLQIEGVSVTYGGPEDVLKDVSLEVAPGEFVALLGASGCGKTTLLRAISGFIPVRLGRVLVSGRDITHAPPDKRNMAMVFQSYALWPHMSAAQNIGYGLRLRGMNRTRIAQRVEEVLGMLKLPGLGDRSVTQLSGGQRQRVALGRALAVNPQLLLLDEPLSNLDAQVRSEVRHEIKALQESLGITTIHVTHDREEAMVMADRLVILDDGSIAQTGTPEEVYNLPVSPFVATFMGANNVMPVDIRSEDGAIRVAGGDHVVEATLPLNGTQAEPGVHLSGPVEGAAAVHFRSESARLVADAEAPSQSLMLRGTITQCSYPGGFYRYAVDVGGRRFMVDDERRLGVGGAVGISLPAASLHLFPASPGEAGSTANTKNNHEKFHNNQEVRI